jgi:hypothetical protein
VLTRKQLPNTLAAADTAEAALNSETAALMKNLTAQSGSNGTQLTIANAVWTNKTDVLKPYSDSMMKLFQVGIFLLAAAAIVARTAVAKSFMVLVLVLVLLLRQLAHMLSKQLCCCNLQAQPKVPAAML